MPKSKNKSKNKSKTKKQVEDISSKARANFSIKNRSIQRFLIFALFFIVISAIMTIDILPEQVRVTEGKPSPETIKAPQSVEFVDKEKTNELEVLARNGVEEIYKYDAVSINRVETNIRNFFKSVKETKENKDIEPKKKPEVLIDTYGTKYSKETINQALSLSPEKLDDLENKSVKIANQFMSGRITQENLDENRDAVSSVSKALQLEPNESILVNTIVTNNLVSNYVYDAEQTEKSRDDAANKVEPVIVKKIEGEVIIQEGQVVTPEQIKILKELGIMKKKIPGRVIAGTNFLILALLSLFAFYLKKFRHDVYNRFKNIVLIGLLLTVTVIFAELIIPLKISTYFIPIAAIAVVISVLFDFQLAAVVVLITTVLTGIITGNSPSYIFVALISGLFAAYIVSGVSSRSTLTKLGVFVFLAVGFLTFTISLLQDLSFRFVLNNTIIGLASGFISYYLVAIGALPFFEWAFKITTDMSLLELANPNQQILKEMMMKAPGTYNHSIIQGNLAESAAESIGANPILARVGAYYHDIGKIKRPYFFVENNPGKESQHDRINPNLSCLIITSHVKEGVEIAQENKLPQEIIDIIEQHHGTSIVTYFYHKAKQTIEKQEVCEIDYRYSGKRPKTKEAALIMLADAVEAAARSMSKPSDSRLKQTIKKIVQSKVDDEQLNESNLTFNDLEKIISSFSKVLTGIYHSRIEYPDVELIDTKRRKIVHGNPDH